MSTIGWCAPHIAEVGRQWVSVALRVEEARMIRQAAVRRRGGAVSQARADVIFAGDEEDDDDVAAMGPDNFVRGLVVGAASSCQRTDDRGRSGGLVRPPRR
jgi:hypothetical protein